MDTNKDTLTKHTTAMEEDDMVSLRDIIDIFLNNWKWFVLSVILCIGASRVYLATLNNVYQRQAVILVKDDNMGSGRRMPSVSTDALMQLNGVLTGTSVKNEVYILQSNQLIQEVVKELNLDVAYSMRSGLRTVSLYDTRPFDVTFTTEFDYPVGFDVEVTDEKGCLIHNVRYANPDVEEIESTFNVAYGDTLSAPFGKLVLTARNDQMEAFVGKKISVVRYSMETATNITQAKITSGEVDRESTLVLLTCNDTNIKRAEDILMSLLNAYKQSIIRDKNQVAQSTAEFIEERIQLIHSELSKVESELADFKENSGLVDVKANSSAFLSQSATARQNTVQAETHYSMVQYLMEYVADNSKGNSLIPVMGGVSDAGIQTQIAKYNEVMLTRNRLAENTKEGSPALKEMDSNLEQMRGAILTSLKGYTASLKLQVDKARAEERGLKSHITSVPRKEKQVLDIARQQAIKETLYTFLLNKREETALQLAITEANIRIVDLPYGSSRPVSPRRSMILLCALALGIAIPYGIIQAIVLLNVGVRGRKDLEKYTTIPVLGEIPQRTDDSEDSAILVAEQNDDPIAEAFRMLRFSMNFMKRDAKVIMFTSTMPGEGKTFVSRNFAAVLGLSGHRVLLVDADIRKRTQSRLSSLMTRQGLTSYLSGASDDLKSMIVSENNECNLDFLPAGMTPPNPAELLMSERLEQCIDELKNMYDYIVIDSVPAQAVADANIVNRVADLTMYVLRAGMIDRRYLPELETLYQEKKFNHLCVVLNGCSNRKKKYGYGYCYGYGYGYGYGNDRKRKSVGKGWKLFRKG